MSRFELDIVQRRLKMLLWGFYQIQKAEKPRVQLHMWSFVCKGEAREFWNVQPATFRRWLRKEEEKGTCNSTCCLAGHIPLIEPLWQDIPAEERVSFWYLAGEVVQERTVDFGHSSEIMWLFDMRWPDNVDQAIGRMYYALTEKKTPHNFRSMWIKEDNLQVPVPTFEQVQEICADVIPLFEGE